MLLSVGILHPLLEYPPTNWKNRHIPKIWATFLLRCTSFVSWNDGRIHYLLFSLKSICNICSYVRFCWCIDFIRGKVNEWQCAGIWILLAQNLGKLKLYISFTDINVSITRHLSILFLPTYFSTWKRRMSHQKYHETGQSCLMPAVHINALLAFSS